VRSISISPDGQWVATGNWHGVGVKLWNVAEGRLVDEDLWPHVPNAGVKFSPDGLRFAASSESQYRVWEVGTWELLYAGARNDNGVGRKLAFSPDGKVLAVSTSSQLVRLLESATGTELATLNSPYSFNIDHLAFNSQGNCLIALDRPLHIWDLGAIRAGLGQLGVDWGQLPYPTGPTRKQVQPLIIDASEIHPGLASIRTDRGRGDEDIKQLAKAIRMRLENREAYENIANAYARKRAEESASGEVSAHTHWCLAVSQLAARDTRGYRETCKAMLRHFAIDSKDSWAKEMTAWVVALHENSEQDVARAIALAEQLVEQRRNATNLRVLGACLYRAGRVEEAHQMLREALPGSSRPAYVFCLLALTSHELRRVDEARTWLNKVDPSIQTDAKVYWATRATVQLLRDQATAAIDG
jgi:tetratricopeptide (TPR) repeat protein